jgi:Domain of unknown function (DUF4352)
MVRMYSKVMLAGSILLFLLAACSGGNTSNSGTPTASNTAITATVITAKSARGTPGNSIIVNDKDQKAVLKDRMLVVNNASKQDAADDHSSLISLVLTVKNTSDKAIKNESTFFQLLSTEGDTFTYQSNSSDTFYGDVSAHSSRDGTIVFQIPKAAASNLRLLYRPEVETETALISLKV